MSNALTKHNSKHIKLKPDFPTLEVARELCKEFKRPVNNYALILNPVVPMVTAGGILLGKEAHKEAQKVLNYKGMLVVKSHTGEDPLNENTDPNKVYEGEYVKFSETHQPEVAFNRVVTSNEIHDGLVLDEGEELKPEMYKKYVVLCMNTAYFTCVVDKPTNDED